MEEGDEIHFEKFLENTWVSDTGKFIRWLDNGKALLSLKKLGTMVASPGCVRKMARLGDRLEEAGRHKVWEEN